MLRDIVKISKHKGAKMLKVTHNKKVYHINKEKLSYIIERLSGEKVKEKELKKYMRKFKLYDEYFLENINKA